MCDSIGGDEMILSKLMYITVAESSALINGRKIHYQLLKKAGRNTVYRIRISFCGEVAEEDISNNIVESTEIYSLMANNLVTPCTFFDVLEDNRKNTVF